MKNFPLFILLILISLKSYSQNKKIEYVDENYMAIDFHQFSAKKASKLYEVLIVQNDTAIFKKLRLKEFYGNVDNKKLNQLKKLFNKKYKLDTTKIWLIHYIDSIPDIKKMPTVSGIEYLDSLNSPTGIFLTKERIVYSNSFKKSKTKRNSNALDSLRKRYRKHRHVLSPKGYLNRITNELKDIEDKVELIHFYEFNKGFPNDSLIKYNYLKD